MGVAYAIIKALALSFDSHAAANSSTLAAMADCAASAASPFEVTTSAQAISSLDGVNPKFKAST